MAMQWIANPSISVRLRVPPPLVSPGGEIGRRKGLKIPRSKGRAGSIPALGTIFIINDLTLLLKVKFRYKNPSQNSFVDVL